MKNLIFIDKSMIILLVLSFFSVGAMAQDETPVTNVETLELKSRRLEIHNTYVGYLKPLERVVISSEAEGIVEYIYFEEGSVIEKGQVLVNIETALLTKQKELSQQNYNLSVKDYNTEQLLLERNVSTSSKVDSLKTQRDINKIQLDISQINLDKSKVKSPLAGVVKQKKAQVGAFVKKGQELLEIMNISQVLVAINIPEKQIQYIKVGKEVNVRIDALPGRVFLGKVKTKGLEADLSNRSFPIEILLDNPNTDLLPGMMARAKILIIAQPNKIIVPRHGVLERENSRIVYIEQNGTAIERPVILGTVIKDEVQILSGLQSGDQLIVTGHHFLTNEEKINVAGQAKQ